MTEHSRLQRYNGTTASCSMRILSGFLLVAIATAASTELPSQDLLRRATALYERTQYQDSLRLLAEDSAPDAAALLLDGKNYLMLGDYKRAIEFFQKAVALSPNNSDYQLWLGRAWGRRAEASGWMMAGMYAPKARQCFEKAVALNPHNSEASNDLFAFYLAAPAFLGGGLDKAETIARIISNERPPQSESELGQIADRRKDYAAAEAHLRRAMELAPSQPGRIVDLARYLAKRGRVAESDALFDQARKIAPDLPRIAFAEARVDIENRRNLERARALLEQYLHASLTPEDPPRQEAEKLLRRAGE